MDGLFNISERYMGLANLAICQTNTYINFLVFDHTARDIQMGYEMFETCPVLNPFKSIML